MMRDKVREAIDRLRVAREQSTPATKSALGRFAERKRDHIDQAFDETKAALDGLTQAEVTSTATSSCLDIGPDRRHFIRFDLEDGVPGAGEVVRVSAEWEDGRGEARSVDDEYPIDDIDRERVDDYLEQMLPDVVEHLMRGLR